MGNKIVIGLICAVYILVGISTYKDYVENGVPRYNTTMGIVLHYEAPKTAEFFILTVLAWPLTP